MMVDALAKRMGFNLRQHGVSLISVEGLNFDSFMPLFGDNALKIPVAVLTDADPVAPRLLRRTQLLAERRLLPLRLAVAPTAVTPAAPAAGEDS